MTGDNVSAAAGRVSFVLGLQDPCSSLDTACASALTAVHWGLHAVKDNECTNALALAVSLKLVPHGTIGAASASLTAPNGSAQRVLLRAVLGRANVSPEAMACTEAHGTGTALGDPTEAGALAAVHGAHRIPLAVGAVNPNPSTMPPLVYRRHAFPWRESLHPLVQRLIPLSDGTVVFHSPAEGKLHALVADHVVQGRVIFPGAGYLEVARAAGAFALRGVYFLQPLTAEAPGLLLECGLSTGRFEVRTSEAEAFEDATVHCSGAVATNTVWQRVSHSMLRTVSHAADVAALYDGFDAVGIQYGPGYRTLVNAWGGASDACARLRTLHA